MKLKLLIEEILDATGNPISSELKKGGIIKSNVLAGKKRTPEESGFCLHNRNVNRFSQGNATQMFLTLAFVFFTIQKEWLLVINFFEDFVKWLFEIAIPNDDWTWKDKGIVGKLGGMYGTGKDENFKIQKTKTKGDKISHVGIYLNAHKFVHVSSSKGVAVNSLEEKYYQNTYTGAGKRP